MIFIKPTESLSPKVFDSSLDQKQMHGDSPYLIMFGKYLWIIHKTVALFFAFMYLVKNHCLIFVLFSLC